ncbi:CZB domain-containing protein [Shewanella sp.]|uniref:CZB domain-containing protein n=1 Tax=Shewanella sp. TaxID=50422 RepID=UPI003A85C17E
MKNLSFDEIKQVLNIVEKSYIVHEKWYEDLIKTLLCRLPIEDRFIGKCPHQKCQFGQWLYSENSRHLRNLPAFIKIEALHDRMHASAKEMCVRMKTTGFVLEHDYVAFLQHVHLFRENMNEFKHRVLSTLAHVENDAVEVKK